MPSREAKLYLDLVKNSLLNIPYSDNELRLRYCQHVIGDAIKRQRAPDFTHAELYNVESTATGKATLSEIYSLAESGKRVRHFAHTMMGRKRLENLENCVSKVLSDNIAGDFIECGVWKGGGGVLMKAVLEVNDIRDRSVWMADSFQGVPPPSLPQDRGIDLTPQAVAWIAVSEERVRDMFRRYQLLDEQVRFLRGWFKDTLPAAPIEKLAILRLDGDLYESTMDAIRPLYDKVSPGGFIIVDDYGAIDACKLAIDEFRAEQHIDDELISIDWTGAYWRKSS